MTLVMGGKGYGEGDLQTPVKKNQGALGNREKRTKGQGESTPKRKTIGSRAITQKIFRTGGMGKNKERTGMGVVKRV